MASFLNIAGIVLGFLAGFGLGLHLLRYATKGENLNALLADKNKKILLGTFGWFTALIGAWIGLQVAQHFVAQMH